MQEKSNLIISTLYCTLIFSPFLAFFFFAIKEVPSIELCFCVFATEAKDRSTQIEVDHCAACVVFP